MYAFVCRGSFSLHAWILFQFPNHYIFRFAALLVAGLVLALRLGTFRALLYHFVTSLNLTAAVEMTNELRFACLLFVRRSTAAQTDRAVAT